MIFVIVATVALIRNAQGEDPKALESALVGKKVPLTTQLIDLFDQRKSYNDQLFLTAKTVVAQCLGNLVSNLFCRTSIFKSISETGHYHHCINYKDDVEKAKKWLNDLGNPYQEVINDQKGSFGLDLGVYGAPETFIVDCQGIIRYRHAGDVNQQVWQQKLQPLYEKYAKDYTYIY